jgi:predicted nucleic acid-binding protein
MSYWDTACLVKTYVEETDSEMFQEFLEARNQVVTSGEIARLEFVTTLWRMECDGKITEGSASTAITLFDKRVEENSCRLIRFDESVRDEFERVVRRCYSQVPPVLVRTLDALHVASAGASGETEIVATDKRLREAAALMGFQLFPSSTP